MQVFHFALENKPYEIKTSRNPFKDWKITINDTEYILKPRSTVNGRACFVFEMEGHEVVVALEDSLFMKAQIYIDGLSLEGNIRLQDPKIQGEKLLQQGFGRYFLHFLKKDFWWIACISLFNFFISDDEKGIKFRLSTFGLREVLIMICTLVVLAISIAFIFWLGNKTMLGRWEKQFHYINDLRDYKN